MGSHPLRPLPPHRSPLPAHHPHRYWFLSPSSLCIFRTALINHIWSGRRHKTLTNGRQWAWHGQLHALLIAPNTRTATKTTANQRLQSLWKNQIYKTHKSHAPHEKYIRQLSVVLSVYMAGWLYICQSSTASGCCRISLPRAAASAAQWMHTNFRE